MSATDSQTLIKAVLCHVAHAKQLYPGGLPEQALSASFTAAEAERQAALPAQQMARMYFLVAVESLDELDGARADFIQAIVEKGMKRSMEHVQIIPVLAGSALEFPEPGATGIFFGQAVATALDISGWEVGKTILYQEGEYLCASSLDDIRSSSQVKKTFWLHLQELLARIQ